jgi:hypothetical protein
MRAIKKIKRIIETNPQEKASQIFFLNLLLV